jgi:hypothetical protein
MSRTRVTGRSGDIIEIELKLTERQRERIVRRLVDWGYLDADDFLDEDDANYARKHGAAISHIAADCFGSDVPARTALTAQSLKAFGPATACGLKHSGNTAVKSTPIAARVPICPKARTGLYRAVH